MTKYTDYFGKPIDWDDWLVSLHDFKSGAYKTDKSLVFQIVGDALDEVVSLDPDPKYSVKTYQAGELYDLVHGDMAVVIEKF